MNPTINPTNGMVVAGVKIDQNVFSGRMKAAQLFQVAVDPRLTENPRQRTGNPQLEGVYRIRELVQRQFAGAKARTVGPYAQYLVALHTDEFEGIAPPIILYSGDQLEVEERDDGTAMIQVPWGKQLVAVDGETQLAARYAAETIEQKTGEDFVPILICHGRPAGWARQAFHDLNVLGIKPNAALGIGMDQRDALTQVAREVERRVPFFAGRVNRMRRQLRANDTEVVTLTALRGACVTFAEGISGIRYGAKPVSVDPAHIPDLKDRAVEWFEAVTRDLGAAIEDRTRTIASAPTVLAAAGAMGHQLLEISDPTERATERQRLLDQLRSVNWSRERHWEGIAGKFNLKGVLSIGGSKETAYAVYAALNDPTSAGYPQVRLGSSLPD